MLFAPAVDARLILSGAAGAFLLLTGCAAGHQAAGSPEELNHTIAQLRTQNAAYARQVEELENRVFILTDQLDSRKVNDERKSAPQLPSVLLRPGDKAALAAPEAPPPSLGESTVEYAGEAAKANRTRPLLKLTGDEPAVVSSTTPALTPVPLVVAGERSSGAPPGASHDDAAPLRVYRRAMDNLQNGQRAEAIAGFREFVRRWPAHDFADNAQYWLGECFYAQGAFDAAVEEFRRVVSVYPRGNKVPDALLKIGFSYLAAGNTDAARQALEQLMRSYPAHGAAELGAAKLAGMKIPVEHAVR